MVNGKRSIYIHSILLDLRVHFQRNDLVYTLSFTCAILYVHRNRVDGKNCHFLSTIFYLLKIKRKLKQTKATKLRLQISFLGHL